MLMKIERLEFTTSSQQTAKLDNHRKQQMKIGLKSVLLDEASSVNGRDGEFFVCYTQTSISSDCWGLG